MSIICPNEGKIEALKRQLYGNAGSENLILKLFRNNVTPTAADVAATYTEATFAGYAAMTLTSSQAAGTWAVPTVSSNLAFSTYGTDATWTIGSGTQTIYGYYIVGASSGKCYYAEAFGAGKPLDGTGVTKDTLTFTVKIQGGNL